MAARHIHRRILSILSTRQPRSSFRTEPSSHFLPSTKSFFTRNEFYKRFQSLSEASKQAIVDVEEHEGCSSKPTNSAEVVSSPINDNIFAVKYNAKSNLKISARHDLAMVFTCKVCDTRSMKTICRESYEKGVVVARCSGCSNLHLIADRLGWFGEPGSVEDLLAARGEEVKKGSVDTLNLTLEDLAGKKSLKV